MGALEDLMTAGLYQAPNAPAFTRALPGYEDTSPFDLAALRTRESVRPTAGRAGEGPSVRDLFNSTPLGALLNLGSSIEPKLPDRNAFALPTTNPIGGAIQTVKSLKNAGQTLAEILGSPAEAAESPEQVMERQKKLAEGGYYKGKIDGN